MNEQLRILVIANLPPYVLGGAENQVARLVEAWAEQGHHIEVAGHRIPDGILHLGSVEISTHRIAIIDWLGRGGRAASYLVSLFRLLLKLNQRFDIIYCRGLGDGAISTCLLKAIGVVTLPLIACPINARGAGDARFIRSIPGWRWIAVAINRHCNAINIIAPAIEGDLAQIGVTEPSLYRIPNGIPLDQPVVRKQISSIRRLIWTGRLTHQKGMDTLLEVLARIASTGRKFQLDIVGDGPDLSMLKSRCKELGLEERVLFCGSLPRNLIRDRLIAADVFVLPSRYEGMSNAALEAMEAGLPIFLTHCGGIDVYIDESVGWVCNPEDSEAMFACLCQLLDQTDRELLDKGRHAREIVELNFSMNFIAQQNIKMMHEIIVLTADRA